MNSTKYIFIIPEDLRLKAKLVCFSRGIPLSEFTREALEQHVKKYKDVADKIKAKINNY